MAISDALTFEDMDAILRRGSLSGNVRREVTPEEKKQQALAKSTLTSVSNSLTGIQNAFSAIYAYTKNITGIHEAQTKKLEEAGKERYMDKGGQPIEALANNGGGAPDFSAFTEKLPGLLEKLDDLGDKLERLDMKSTNNAPSSPITTALDTAEDIASVALPGKSLLGTIGKGALIAGGTAAAGYLASEAISGMMSDTPQESPLQPDINIQEVKPNTTAADKVQRENQKSVAAVKNINARVNVQASKTTAAGPTATRMPSGPSMAQKFAMFLGSTFRNVTDYVASLPSRLASLGSGAMEAIGSFGEAISEGLDTISSGGGAADMEQAIDRAGIKDPTTKAQIMAQTAHESMNFKRTTEMGNRAYFNRYEGRKDLGNVQPGDGYKYRGRGFLQVTGRANYAEMSKALGVDFVNNPDLLADPKYAAASAIIWFRKRSNRIKNWGDTKAVTKVVNGGYNGLPDREAKFAKFLNVYKGGGSAAGSFAGAVSSGRQAVQTAGAAVGRFVDTVKDVAGNFMDYFTVQPSVDMSGMKQPMVKRLKAMGAEYKQKTGKKIIVASAFRSRAKQEELYRLYLSGRGNPAAKPGTSKHESGLAIDLNRDQADWLEQTGMLRKYGLHRPDRRASERQHVEPVEGRNMPAQPDNPYKPGTPIATVGKGTKPVALGNGQSQPVPRSKPLTPLANQVAVQQRVKGGRPQTTVVVNQSSPQTRPGSPMSVSPGGRSGPKSNPSPIKQYLAYLGVG